MLTLSRILCLIPYLKLFISAEILLKTFRIFNFPINYWLRLKMEFMAISSKRKFISDQIIYKTTPFIYIYIHVQFMSHPKLIIFTYNLRLKRVPIHLLCFKRVKFIYFIKYFIIDCGFSLCEVKLKNNYHITQLYLRFGSIRFVCLQICSN